MFTVVRNLAVDHHRARAVRPQETPPVDDVGLTVNDAIEPMLTTQVVLDALNQLKPAQRDAITLMHYRAYSIAQAAETLGVRPGTVKSRSHYAMRALRTILQSRGVLHP
ncbi:sigma factor-like helix-turn-helix DNA-binding protein [Streptomyces cupreus]|uniref:RNA polymerase n=1 Tax=Streptomyces cupreus TaxID=2759956 RepID=A0A7X1MAU0_9ACTN|nr:sigma factor-like helix-turn-helix DNA-binding protein [Streptomyces cupreus]MBC2904689.1 RNA polymerase [Streptomyces cupreus]